MEKLYYIVDAVDYEAAQIVADTGRNVPYVPKPNLADTRRVYKMLPELAGAFGQGYTNIEMRELLDTIEWTETPSEDNEVEL